ncbi:hypothetical protein CVT24_004059 [Panaeolus cyanescens]|uniref:PUB domain-containing protein n=1 Tax=Panaeolus cyanescens TaxID=181874 RepID=A0A409Y6J9_9AGAR|nr:hypothetical protein CVT24_004059 [Panaeolus cyanescens]
MSTPGSPSQPTTQSASPSVDALAAAAERRLRQEEQSRGLTAAQMAAQHDKRQHFRRLIDPGIVRPNSKEQASRFIETCTSTQILLTISENLIKEPGNPKYQRFKPTNSIIKRDLVEPKGALEYAIEMGFRPEVENFQPFYVFNPRRIEDIKIGAAMLKEYVDLETEKEERRALAKKNEKAAKEAAAERVKLAFMDDRQTKQMRDEMEKVNRDARIARAQAASSNSPAVSPVPDDLMPGSGHVLGRLGADDADDAPPEYEKMPEIAQ